MKVTETTKSLLYYYRKHRGYIECPRFHDKRMKLFGREKMNGVWVKRR